MAQIVACPKCGQPALYERGAVVCRACENPRHSPESRPQSHVSRPSHTRGNVKQSRLPRTTPSRMYGPLVFVFMAGTVFGIIVTLLGSLWIDSNRSRIPENDRRVASRSRAEQHSQPARQPMAESMKNVSSQKDNLSDTSPIQGADEFSGFNDVRSGIVPDSSGMIPMDVSPRTSPVPEPPMNTEIASSVNLPRIEADSRREILNIADDPGSVSFADFEHLGLIRLGESPGWGPYYGVSVRFREKNAFGALQLRHRVVVFEVEADQVLGPEDVSVYGRPVVSTNEIRISKWNGDGLFGMAGSKEIEEFFNTPSFP